jgi:hypothetical protein
VQPERPPAAILAEARRLAAEHQEGQVRQVAETLRRDLEEVTTQLEGVVDRVEIRVTRSLSVCRYLRDELEAGRVPTIRSVFETARQDHTDDTADQVRAIMVEVTSADDPDLAHLRVVAERQGIPLVVRVLGGT